MTDLSPPHTLEIPPDNDTREALKSPPLPAGRSGGIVFLPNSSSTLPTLVTGSASFLSLVSCHCSPWLLPPGRPVQAPPGNLGIGGMSKRLVSSPISCQ